MGISEARHRANEKYNAKAYDEIKLRVAKGEKERIQTWARQHGSGSVNSYIIEAKSVQQQRQRQRQTRQRHRGGIFPFRSRIPTMILIRLIYLSSEASFSLWK